MSTGLTRRIYRRRPLEFDRYIAASSFTDAPQRSSSRSIRDVQGESIGEE